MTDQWLKLQSLISGIYNIVRLLAAVKGRQSICKVNDLNSHWLITIHGDKDSQLTCNMLDDSLPQDTTLLSTVAYYTCFMPSKYSEKMHDEFDIFEIHKKQFRNWVITLKVIYVKKNY